MNDKLADVSAWVEEIKTIDDTMESLKEQREILRKQVLSTLHSSGVNSLQVELEGDESYTVTRRTSSSVSYDEETLKERLDREKYCQLLELDSKKLKKEQSRVLYYLKPMLEDVGKISAKLVKAQIESGGMVAEDFKGAFTKKEREALYIRKVSKKDEL